MLPADRRADRHSPLSSSAAGWPPVAETFQSFFLPSGEILGWIQREVSSKGRMNLRSGNAVAAGSGRRADLGAPDQASHVPGRRNKKPPS